MKSAGSWIVAGAVLLGIATRVCGLFTDLWLDEIWSVHLVRRATSVLDALRRTTENNHPLNTLWIYALRDQQSWPLFRLHSLLAGIGTVALAGALGLRQSRRTGFLSLLIFSLSFVLVAFSSEARGYALATAFALAALLCLDRFFKTRSSAAAALFGVSCVLGFLAHVLFVHAYAAGVAWTAWKLTLPRSEGRLSLRDIARLHAAPLVFAALFYLGFVRELEEGQGPESDPLTVAADAAAAALGLPMRAPFTAAGALVVSAVSVTELRRKKREGDDSWVFYATVIFLSPAVVVLLARYRFLMVRHLILSIAFFLLLLARFLADFLARGRVGRVVAVSALAVFTAANLVQTAGFLKDGRGHYLEALRSMVARAGESRVTIGGDHDFRNLVTISFYKDYLPTGKEVTYFTDDSWPPEGPEWVIVHSVSADATPLPSVTPHGIVYVLDTTYRYHGFSGLCWFVYRRERGLS